VTRPATGGALPRLNGLRLDTLPAHIRRPAYRPAAHGAGIVHLGLGAFHKAHQCVYLDELLAHAGGDWRVIGLSCRSPLPRDQLQPQDFLYTLIERDAQGDRLRVIGALADVLVAPENPAAAVAVMARPATQIISVTVTEKGYCRAAADGRLDLEHPDIAHDLRNPERPRSAPGLLTAAMRHRHAQGVAPPTLLCCDNLPRNGATLHGLLVQMASHAEPRLADWIERRVACPSTMVDRIVPAATDEDRQQFARSAGVLDEALVKTEPFRQWVVEDRFSGPRPALEEVGVQLVADVGPYEVAKLRLLNGSHSALAYLGLAAGDTFVHEAIADPALRALIRELMSRELAPTLPAVPGLDLDAYQNALLGRFANPSLRHGLRQIAMDGSQKLPQRLLQPLLERLRRGERADAIVLVIAAWMHYALGRAGGGTAYRVDDPLAATFAAIALTADTGSRSIVAAFLGLRAVFDHELAAHAALRDALAARLDELAQRGSRATVRAFLTQRHAGQP